MTDTMTTQQFYRHLDRFLATDEDVSAFQLMGCLRLTVEERDFCPITYVAYRLGHGRYRMAEFVPAARAMGMSTKDATRLQQSADCHLDHVPTTRRALVARLTPYMTPYMQGSN